MRVGLQLPLFTWAGGAAELAPRLTEIAQMAEDAGFASLWVMDHYYQLPSLGAATEPMLECYTTLGYLAHVTRRIKLGPLAVGVVYHQPGPLVKTATTLDVLSGGRSYFAVGAAWYEEEARALGVPWSTREQRFEMLEETLQIAHQMWRTPPAEAHPYTGIHYHLARPFTSPPPLQTPHPPIMVAGNGERKTLRLVAQYADACNFLVCAPTEIRHKTEVLKRHCEAADRPFADIERTALNELDLRPGAMTVREVIDLLRALANVGIQHAIINLPNAEELTPLDLFRREIIPAVAGLPE